MDKKEQFAFSSGTKLKDGAYELMQLRAVGGFSLVYDAVCCRNGKKVIVKELMDEQMDRQTAAPADKIALFRQEAQVLQQLQGHPGIVQMVDFFEENQTAYLVMEAAEGRTLVSVLREQGAVQEQRALVWASSLLQSLDWVHEKGWIHGDLSLGNLVEQPDHSLKLLDFGAAMPVGGTTGMGQLLIRGPYAAPEQRQLGKAVSPATDLYAAGGILFHCLTGRQPPVAAETEKKVRLPWESAVSRGVKKLVERAMQPRPDRRFSTAAELKKAVDAQLPKGRNRRRWKLAAACAAAALLAAGAWLQYDAVNPFHGRPTETFVLRAPEQSDPALLQDYDALLREKLQQFCGKHVCRFDLKQQTYTVTVPAESFGENPVGPQIGKAFSLLLPDLPMEYRYAPAVHWEQPEQAYTLGQYQCSREDLKGTTVCLSYVYAQLSACSEESWRQAEWSVKKRLDALQTPYAFGSLADNRQGFAVQLAPEVLNPVVVQLLGSSIQLRVAGQQYFDGVTVGFMDRNGQQVQLDREGLRLLPDEFEQKELQAFLQALAAKGENRLYLYMVDPFCLGRQRHLPVSYLPLEQAAAESLVFPPVQTANSDGADRYLPFLYCCAAEGKRIENFCPDRAVVFSEEGEPLLQEDPERLFGTTVPDPEAERMRLTAESLQKEMTLRYSIRGDGLFLYLDLPMEKEPVLEALEQAAFWLQQPELQVLSHVHVVLTKQKLGLDPLRQEPSMFDLEKLGSGISLCLSERDISGEKIANLVAVGPDAVSWQRDLDETLAALELGPQIVERTSEYSEQPVITDTGEPVYRVEE